MTETTESGVPEQMRSDDPRNPLDNAELVVYTADTEYAEDDPTHPALKELGLWSWSLWARWVDEMIEIPLVGEASGVVWYSLSAESFHPDPAETISDSFVIAIAQMVDDEWGDGWGDFDKSHWENMSDLEGYILQNIRTGFLMQKSETPALVIDWCKSQCNTEST